MSNLKRPILDEKIAYEAMKSRKEKFGIFHKACFHLHTPASYDYRLFDYWEYKDYLDVSEQNLYEKCIDQKVFPETVDLEKIILEGKYSCYRDKKELLAYTLLAHEIISNQIGIVLITDHHTISGIDKLKVAISGLCKMKTSVVYPEVVLGIEISCADKNHVVGIFEDDKSTRGRINEWLEENVLTLEDGSFKTSIDVLQFIRSINGIGYIAHLDSSDTFKEKYLSGAYKEKLFSKDLISFVGLANYENKAYIEGKVKLFRSEPIGFIIDNDAHDIQSIEKNIFWLKGSKRNYSMIKEALDEYDISVSLEGIHENNMKQHIKGIYVENSENGFLCNKEEDAFCLTFSSALNCLIGGRGTGKSSILEVLEYILSQRCESEDKLEFICAHGNAWVLYEYCNEEYLIEMRMPIKVNADDNILQCFGQNIQGRYHFKYYYSEDQIRDHAFKHFLKISRVVYSKGDWHLEAVANKREMLKKFFDIRYSINELVNTAGGEKINKFIYDTLFENRTISRPEDIVSFRKKSGLKKMLGDVQDALCKRKKDVDLVIEPFNKNQKGILRIVYSQNATYIEPPLEEWLFYGQYSARKWYERYNITQGNVIEYLMTLFDSLGIFEFLSMIVNTEVHVAEKMVNFLDFCTNTNKDMVEQGIESLTPENVQVVIEMIFSNLVTDDNIRTIIEYLKNYVSNVEGFSLEFNINNKEGSVGDAIYRSVERLSLGQKVVAMLSFVLGYSEYSEDYRPLIIDQPEDNLDNQYIYKNLIKQLRTLKEKRQVIIATHNATIVTNAKADQVCVMLSDNVKGWIGSTGYPGEKRIKKQILNYLEGGKESFLHKYNVYKDALK